MEPAISTAAESASDVLVETLGLTPPQAAAVLAVGRLVAQHAEQALSAALAQPVQIGTAHFQRMEPAEIERENWGGYHPVDVRLQVGGATYAPVLMLPNAELQTLLPAARGAADLPDMEALGRVLRDVAAQLDARLQQEVSPPVRLSLPDTGAALSDPQQPVLRIEHRLLAGQPGAQADLTVVHLVPLGALQAIAEGPASGTPTAQENESSPSGQSESPGSPGAGGGASDMEDNMASTQPATSVHGVQFQPLDGELEATSATNLDLLLDVSLRVSVELGRTDLSIKEVLGLGPGSVIELDKLAGEPVDILVNNRLIAKGEVVVVDENFGVRVTDIVSPQKLVGKLR